MPESRRRGRAPARSPARTTPDACPGAWRRHQAADGALARFRLVGGMLTGAELRVLAGAAVAGGAPLELTSRGSVQVRGLSPRGADDLGDALRGLADGTDGADGAGGAGAAARARTGAGPTAVLDGRGRELPCGLVASPRSRALGPVLAAVASGLRGRTDVPGRFLVALDDGTGDVTALDADVTVTLDRQGEDTGTGTAAEIPADDEKAALRLDGVDTGLRIHGPSGAAALALAAVDAFTAVADGHWRLAEVPGGVEAVARGVCERVATERTEPALRPAGSARPHPGVGDDGALEVLPRLGEIDPRAAAALVAEIDAGADLRVTPWRSLVLLGSPDPATTVSALAAAGLETRADTPWAGLSACVGAPRCAKALRDVRGDLVAAVESGHAGAGRVAAHWIGCGRACGTPGGRVAVVEALRGGPSGPGAYRTVVRAGRAS